MIIDVFPFFNELDVLEYRLKTLYNSVDKFVIVEGNITHAGKTKPSYFTENQARYQQYMDKICYFQADLPETKEQLDAFDSRIGMMGYGDTWKREYAQRNAAQEALQLIQLQDDDIVIISDADEIPNIPQLLANFQPDAVNYLNQYLFAQCIHTLIQIPWNSAFACTYKIIKQTDINLLRLKSQDQNIFKKVFIQNCGWHITYFGTAKHMQTKLNNFAHQEQAVQQFNNFEHLNQSVKSHKMFNGTKCVILKDDLSDFQGTLPPDIDYVLKHFQYCKKAE